MEGVNPVGLNLIFDITNETPVPGGRQLLSSRMRQRGCPYVSFNAHQAIAGLLDDLAVRVLVDGGL